jgi:hypothetical protein
MELFRKEFVPELNTKNLGNSTSFLTITHTTLSAKRFRKYGILRTYIAATMIKILTILKQQESTLEKIKGLYKLY